MVKFKILEHSTHGFPADDLGMVKIVTSAFFAETDALLGVRNLLKWEFSFNMGNCRIFLPCLEELKSQSCRGCSLGAI